MRLKNDFHINYLTLSLGLKRGLHGATRKWPICTPQSSRVRLKIFRVTYTADRKRHRFKLRISQNRKWADKNCTNNLLQTTLA